MMLMNNLQLCLAHYCDIHGPTPLMVTEGLPVSCGSCHDSDYDHVGDRPHGGAQVSTATMTEALRRLNFSGSHRGASRSMSEEDTQARRAALHRASQRTAAPGPAAEPSGRGPGEHRRGDSSGSATPSGRDSNFRRTYDDYVTKRANPCDNCAMTLPRRQEGGGGDGKKGDKRTPTLRTRAPVARVYTDDESPPASQTASSSDTDGEGRSRIFTHRRSGTITSTTSRSSTSSASRRDGHTHYLDYTSTHEPIVANSFSVIRASCLRTLSIEMLPPGAPGSASSNAAPLVSPQTPSFVTTQSAGAVASGGPIFFGDPVAGYTTAHIFRIPDIHARGHKRLYAFLVVSKHPERLSVKTLGFISAAFHELASWVHQLAEAEAERLSESTASSPVMANPAQGASAFNPSLAAQFENPGGSSFLSAASSGWSRRMGGGYGGPGTSLRARGLPELVGLPDFFIELHARFVRLLLELGVMLNS